MTLDGMQMKIVPKQEMNKETHQLYTGKFVENTRCARITHFIDQQLLHVSLETKVGTPFRLIDGGCENPLTIQDYVVFFVFSPSVPCSHVCFAVPKTDQGPFRCAVCPTRPVRPIGQKRVRPKKHWYNRQDIDRYHVERCTRLNDIG